VQKNLPASSSAPPAKTARWQIISAGLLIFGFLVYFFQPGFSSWAVRKVLVSQAHKAGWDLELQRVEANLFTGKAELRGIQASPSTQKQNRLQCQRIAVDFSPWLLFFDHEISPTKEILMRKCSVTWDFASPLSAGKSFADPVIKPDKSSRARDFFPAKWLVTDFSLDLRWEGGRLEISEADFHFDTNTTGAIHLPLIEARQGRWTKKFANLKGVTALKNRAFYVGGVRFSPTLDLERAALDFTRPDLKKITSDLQWAAFGGEGRADIEIDRRKADLQVEAATSFWNLSVSEVGDFLGNDEFAEGTLHEGRVTFRGSPAEPSRATTALRINATDFRWHQRRWNSFIASALLVNRRLEIPQFDLVQEKNKIRLKGNSSLPGKGWEIPETFDLQVQAEIDDLQSAIGVFFPEQEVVSGEAFFAGDVRRQKEQFSGNLKMRGGPLQVRGIDIDRVRGDLALNGTEISARSLEFARGKDLATGWATLNLSQPRRYSGEIETSAANVASYGPILPRIISNRAVSGGAKWWWSGDGSAAAHSGAFKVKLNDFILSQGPNAVPIDVESYGSYSPAGITLNQLIVQRPNARLETAVFVRTDSVELRNLQITGSRSSQINGDISLPVNILAALETPTWTAFYDSQASASGRITGKKVALSEIGELTGTLWPVRGRADFDLTLDGPWEALKGSLALALSDFSFENRWLISALSLDASHSENHLQIQARIHPEKDRDRLLTDIRLPTAFTPANLAAGRWLDREKPLTGTLEATRFDTVKWHPWVVATRPFSGEFSARTTLEGTLAQPIFAGTVTAQNLNWQPSWLPAPLQKIQGPFTVARDQIQTDRLTGLYRGGTWELSGLAGAATDLVIDGKNLTLSASDDPSEAVVSGSVRWQRTPEDNFLIGRLTFQNAVLHRDLSLSETLPELAPRHPFRLPWVPPDWQIDLLVKSESPIDLRGRIAQWQLTPELRLTGTGTAPLLQGQIQLNQIFPGLEKAVSETFIFTHTPLEAGTSAHWPVEPKKETATLDFDHVNFAPAPILRLEILPLAPLPTVAH